MCGGTKVEGRGNSVAPELVAHAANRDGGGGFGDAGELEVEGADGEVSGADRAREEGGEDVGRVVILPTGWCKPLVLVRGEGEFT